MKFWSHEFFEFESWQEKTKVIQKTAKSPEQNSFCSEIIRIFPTFHLLKFNYQVLDIILPWRNFGDFDHIIYMSFNVPIWDDILSKSLKISAKYPLYCCGLLSFDNKIAPWFVTQCFSYSLEGCLSYHYTSQNWAAKNYILVHNLIYNL